MKNHFSYLIVIITICFPFYSKAQIVGGDKTLPGVGVKKSTSQIPKKEKETTSNGKKSLPVSKNTPPKITLLNKNYELSILDDELKIYWTSIDKDGDNITPKIRPKNHIYNTYPDIKITGKNQAIISKLTNAGLYKFEIYLLDNKGNTSNIEEFVITVNNPPAPNIKIEGTSTKIFSNGSMKLTAKNSNQNNRLKYRWSQQYGNSLSIESNTGESVNLSYLQPGNYSVSVVATDIIGRESIAYFYFQVVSENNNITSSNITSSIVSTSLRGGPKNAILNLLIPGLGHYYVSGDYKGDNRRKSAYAVTASYFGLICGATFCKIKSNSDYEQYKKVANQLEYQYDLNGSVIGIRGVNQSNAEKYYKTANSYNKIYKSLLFAAGGIFVTDFIYTLYRGFDNQKRYNRYSGTKVRFGINYNTFHSSFEPVVKVDF